MGESLRDMLPRDKHDTDRAVAIVGLGYPAIRPVISDLLEWMQDINWPVARVLQLPLARIGLPLAAYLRPILNCDDDIWKQVIISRIVAYSPDLAKALKPELERIASMPTAGERAEEADAAAQDVLGDLLQSLVFECGEHGLLIRDDLDVRSSLELALRQRSVMPRAGFPATPSAWRTPVAGRVA